MIQLESVSREEREESEGNSFCFATFAAFARHFQAAV
jgi:hypothetical protein